MLSFFYKIYSTLRHYFDFKLLLLETNKRMADFYRSSIQSGKDNYIGRFTKITEPEWLYLGNEVIIDDFVELETFGGVSIGDGTYIGAHTVISTVNYSDCRCSAHVIIGRQVIIGAGCIIGPGSVIPDYAVIPAGSNIDANSVVFNSKDAGYFDFDSTNTQMSIKQRKLLGELKKQKLYHQQAQQSNRPAMFFVLSTGRAGSTTFSGSFSQHSHIECLHEPKRQLIALSTDFAHGIKNEAEIKKQLNAIYTAQSYSFSKPVYGESDQKLANLSPIMAELFPEAKFIWLIRDGRDFVSSAFARGWFDDYEFDFSITQDKSMFNFYRKHFSLHRTGGHKSGFYSKEEWDNAASFARCCMYWSFWNEMIERDLKQLSPNRYYFVKLEELKEKKADILHFLSLKDEDISVSVYNAYKHGKPAAYASWTSEQKEVFKKYCGQNMKRWYGVDI